MSPRRGHLFLARAACALIASMLPLGWTGSAAAESVDTELVLLVDVSAIGMNRSQFDSFMEAYADWMTSSEVLASIQSGAIGRIAVSMRFFGGTAGSSVGIPWMSIGSLQEANAFASAALALTKLFSGFYGFSAAMNAAVASFGSETGNADNGFQSTLQIVEVTAARLVANFGNPTGNALAAGVDQVNATTVGRWSSQLESYYASNVIGGEINGVAATVNSGDFDAGLSGMIQGQLTTNLATASAVPEPSMGIIILSSMAMLVLCSRQRQG